MTHGSETAIDAWCSERIADDRVWILKDGEQTYPAMLRAIEGAQHTIVLETYILKDDDTGHRFAAALEARARAGVEVSVMYDAWGSSVPPEFAEQLTEAGVRLVAFRPVRLFGPAATVWAHLRRRNHRKSLVVDSHIGFLGGINISDDYDSEEHGGRGWRDTHLRVEGPAAAQLEKLFLETWSSHRGAPMKPRPARHPVGPHGVTIIGNHFAKGRKDIRKAYVSAFVAAKTEINLTQAYFLPPARVMRALFRARRRGVRVRVILAAATDVKLVLFAARGLYRQLLRAGVEVYEWKHRILHAKTAVVDTQWVTVGSSNLDALSLRRNLEVNAVMSDARLGASMVALFEDDLTHCTRITEEALAQRSWLDRVLSWCAYRFRHWL